MTCVQIAETMGRSVDGVYYALDPEKYRKRRAQYPKTVHGPRQCDERKGVRAEARHRWRAEGRTRPLERYYRDLECL